MEKKVSFASFTAIGFMLFALFFGAGNLIFPAHLGQMAGENIWIAAIGFLATGVGLPLLGVLAIAYSGSEDLQDLASRIHPIYGISFTVLLYLSIGPFFAAPRTATVAYEVGIAPFVPEQHFSLGLLIFSIVFFLIALGFSLFPARLVENVGKILAPSLIVLLAILLVAAIINPMGTIGDPLEAYQVKDEAFTNGFLEGYNTMDALASLVFGIIVIHTIMALGITNRKDIFFATAKSGAVATILLGVIYLGIMYLGAMSTEELGFFENGGPVLNGTAIYYFGTFGAIILAGVIILACLTTAIGLIIANSEYFHTLIPRISYKTFVFIFTILTATVANFGLENIITFSIPVLMFLYPLAIVLILLTFTSKLFKDSRAVYVVATVVTFLISIFNGLESLTESLNVEHYGWMKPIVNVYSDYLPLYDSGLGWLLPAIIIIIIGVLSNIGSKAAKI